MNKIKVIDLFAGCGGLLDGFMQSGIFEPVASVEWQKHQVNTLRNRLKTKWNIQDSEESVLHIDIQRAEIFSGWKNDLEYGEGIGLDKLVSSKSGVDIIIGGPPCQAYSIAGRVRDKNGMSEDYRNYLFEHYLAVVNRYKPKFFIFENVPGMLSAMPDGTPIPELIKRDAQKIGYEIVDNIKGMAQFDISDFGVAQNRKRIILLGVNREQVPEYKKVFEEFYNVLMNSYKAKKKITLEECIGDLPKIMPLKEIDIKKRLSHQKEETVSWHVPRYHNSKDVEVFKMLAHDIESGQCKYTNSQELNKIYEQITGKKTSVHKYHVLRKDKPSTTILAHLHKDGLRFIHYDSMQARSITVREAARIQSFEDDFNFIGPQGAAYQMIGNAVPPKFAKCIANAIGELFKKY